MTDEARHEDEYDEAMVTMLELIWGQGFFAPGGTDSVRRAVEGLDLEDKLVLDIGSGVGGGDLYLAGELGARIIGIDLELPLVERARRYAEQAGLAGQVEFRHVEPGPLPFDAATFDVVFSSGCFTQVADKAGMFAEIYRVLKPGGWLTVYDWMKGPDSYSDDMRYWFKMEGLTYAMETLEAHGRLLEDAGFTEVALTDDGGWYRERCRAEYEEIKGPLSAQMRALLGPEKQAHFVEDWRAMLVVLDNGELRPGYYRGMKPAS